MRTTPDIDETLLSRARALATREGTTLTRITLSGGSLRRLAKDGTSGSTSDTSTSASTDTSTGTAAGTAADRVED